ncbi:PREDICTED: uncharacterized protein LOC106806149 [Priapulus caudatus]|uniref:Uncharacterized protein LOC106806149 n=1 Tax=Priapulus caudatus TaxID=37621 RepID=A0ABM1DU77_PRICU|nr:PREDICTED: uncharacterized protein LOC106806149 [Priapulus caudatus]
MSASPSSSADDSNSDAREHLTDIGSRASTPADAVAVARQQQQPTESGAGFTIKNILGLSHDAQRGDGKRSSSPTHVVGAYDSTATLANRCGTGAHAELLKPTPLIRTPVGAGYSWIPSAASSASPYGLGFSPFAYHLQSTHFPNPQAPVSALPPNPFLYGTFFGRPIPVNGGPKPPAGKRSRKPGIDRKPRQAYSTKQLEKLEEEFKTSKCHTLFMQQGNRFTLIRTKWKKQMTARLKIAQRQGLWASPAGAFLAAPPQYSASPFFNMYSSGPSLQQLASMGLDLSDIPISEPAPSTDMSD